MPDDEIINDALERAREPAGHLVVVTEAGESYEGWLLEYTRETLTIGIGGPLGGWDAEAPVDSIREIRFWAGGEARSIGKSEIDASWRVVDPDR